MAMSVPTAAPDTRTIPIFWFRKLKSESKSAIFEEYQKLKEIEWQQNLKNEKKDRYISTKYAKLISFMTKNAKLIAIFIVALICLLPYLIFMLVI